MFVRYGNAMHEQGGPRWRVQRTLMRATFNLRARPNFLLIGASQSGTTSFFSYLTAVPGVLPPLAKELRYFDRNYERGPAWYRSFFPLRLSSRLVAARLGVEPAIGEATPAYLWHPRAPARVHEYRPGLRLIALLRDPVDRAYSDFIKRRANSNPGISFEEALEQEEERIAGEIQRMESDPAYVSTTYRRFAYVDKGRYAEQLDRWLGYFPREQLLVLTTEDLGLRPADVIRESAAFLGLPEPPPGKTYLRRNASQYEPMAPKTRERLAGVFEEPNRRLYELIGRDLGWTRPPLRSRGAG